MGFLWMGSGLNFGPSSKWRFPGGAREGAGGGASGWGRGRVVLLRSIPWFGFE